MNLRGRVSWEIVDALWSAELTTLSRVVATMFGFDSFTTGKSWRGSVIDAEQVIWTVRSSSGEVVDVSGGAHAIGLVLRR
jgi:steroid 5-alpha reductase family enzyme